MQSTPLTIAQVEDRLAAFMRLRGQTMRRYFFNIGLFNGHPAMLFHIARQPGITQTEIAQRMEISKASVAVSVKRMETAGLLRREADPTDRRVTHLYLTPAGETMDAACARARDFMMDSLYDGLTPEELSTLYTLIGKLQVNLQVAHDKLPAADGKDE